MRRWLYTIVGLVLVVSLVSLVRSSTLSDRRLERLSEIDYDSGAGFVPQTVVGVALPASGGPVAGGTSTNPLRTDTTGTTSQPVVGPGADGAAVVGNPVRIGGKDSAGNTQDILTAGTGAIVNAFSVTGADGIGNSGGGRLYDESGNTVSLFVWPFVFNGTSWDRPRSGSATNTDPHYGAASVYPVGGAFTLLSTTTQTADTTGSYKTGLGGFGTITVTWDIDAADRADANETYDLYIQMSDGASDWDVVHFPQVITTGEKHYTASFKCNLSNTNILKTDTSGADQGTRTLAANSTRDGICGDRLRYDIDVGGTTPSMTHSIIVTVKP